MQHAARPTLATWRRLAAACAATTFALGAWAGVASATAPAPDTSSEAPPTTEKVEGDEPIETGEVDGTTVAVVPPPVPTTTIVAVGLPPVPPTTVVVAVGTPPVPRNTVADAPAPAQQSSGGSAGGADVVVKVAETAASLSAALRSLDVAP